MDNRYVAPENATRQAEFDYIALSHQLLALTDPGCDNKKFPVSKGLLRIIYAELKYWHDRAVEKTDE